MKILVTGGTGYIGTYLTKFLAETDHECIITSRTPANCEVPYLVRKLELLETETIFGISRGVDAVVHLANYDEVLVKSNPKEALLANAYATRELFLDAVRNGVSKFIYFSTFHVYGKSSGEIDENTRTEPISDYGLTHLFAEMYLKELSLKSQIETSILRLSNGIGAPPGDSTGYLIFNEGCKSAFENQKIVLQSSGLQKRDFVAIKDICKAVRLLLDKNESNSLFNVYNTHMSSTR
jgi:UDP-glucose 4-epimerase